MTTRFKLTTWFIAVVLIVNTVIAVLTVRQIEKIFIDEVQTRVSLDLNSAHREYQNYLSQIRDYLKGVSFKRSIAEEGTLTEDIERSRLLDNIRKSGSLDIFTLLDSKGRVLYRANNHTKSGDSLTGNPLVSAALQSKKALTGTVLVPRESLAIEGTELLKKAYSTILSTPGEEPSDQTELLDGMAAAAAVPILDSDGNILRVLYGAVLLNRRFELVDQMKDDVFQNQTYLGKDIGTTTIFQNDVRIATNVTKEDGTRAIGTRLSAEVYEQVLKKGKVWADRAFVVNDWYITAYEPIRDPSGRIIGALYVGLLEAPFLKTQNVLTDIILWIMGFATLAGLALILFVIRHFLWPIDKIIAMSRKIIDGDLSARISIRPPGEMGVLCRAIDSMADTVTEREERLKEFTRQQIGQSEKLASIGRLAAGIAHEINNPLTGVLTFSHLLLESENMTQQDQKDLEVIIRETTRVREIVRGLLEFARERPSKKRATDLNEVVRHTMKLARSQKEFGQFTVNEKLDDSIPSVYGDKNQLQQVILNLAFNAAEAMPNGGNLNICTFCENEEIVLIVSDTGCGIKKEDLEQIFEPFFTTKPVGKGTGLGLAISYGIIQKHGGTLEVDSREGEGTTFTIRFPRSKVDQNIQEDENECTDE